MKDLLIAPESATFSIADQQVSRNVSLYSEVGSMSHVLRPARRTRGSGRALRGELSRQSHLFQIGTDFQRVLLVLFKEGCAPIFGHRVYVMNVGNSKDGSS